MANRTIIFTPSGGMNQDDSLVTPTDNMAGKNAFEAGDYRYLLNLRDNFGDLDTIKGTTEVTDYYVRSGAAWISGTRPTGTESVRGKYSDQESRRIYYAVYNSNSNHCIRFYEPSTNRVYELLKWSGLAFTSTMFVSMAMVDNFLALTDRVNRPRMMNVDTISDLFNDLTSTHFREFHIAFHKWAPCPPPMVRVYYDGFNNNFTKLRDKAWQFAYRWIYNDKLKSRYSPISKTAITLRTGDTYTNSITAIEVDIPGSILDVPGANVAYNFFDHADQKFYKAVEKIELVYRETELDIWKVWKTVDADASFSRYQYFTGDADQTPVQESDFNQPFDTVPFLAGTVVAIDNRFMFGDCLDEHEPFTGLNITNVASVADPAEDWNDSAPGSFPQFAAGPKLVLHRTNALSNFNFKSRAIYKCSIQFLGDNGWRSAGYTIPTWVYNVLDTGVSSARIYAFNFLIANGVVPPEWATSYQILRTNALNIDYFMYGIANNFKPLVDVVNSWPDSITASDAVKQAIQEHFANSKVVSGYEFSQQLAKETLKEQLPPIADRLVESATRPRQEGNSLMSKALGSYLKDNSIKDAIAAQVRETGFGALADAGRIYIDINNWYNAAKQTATKDRPLNNLYYNFRTGDRVRFLGSTVATNPTSNQKTVFDVPILEFTGRALIIEKPVGLLWMATDASAESSDFYIEVYSPKVPSADDHIYYETGEWYPILYPGHASRDFSKKDFVYTNNAAVTLTTQGPFYIFHKMPLFAGDCYNVIRSIYRNTDVGGPSTGTLGNAMNPDPTKTYGFWNRNNGRPALAYRDLPVKQFKTTQIRFGGKIIEQSYINSLNRFEDANQKIYPSEYGRIRSLVNTANAQVESVGSILLAIGERETFSIYVNRTTFEDLSGRTQVALSDKILGSYNTLLGSHGTLNPESVSIERGRVAFWDAVHGAWIRYGRDGLTVISDYKMSTWFKDLGDLLIDQYDSVAPWVISEYNRYDNELYTYISHSSLPATFRDYAVYKGSRFSEDKRRWRGCHGYTPEMFAKINNLFISFRGGSVYTHETSNAYSTFYGTKQDCYIEPVFNETPMNVKSWQNISYVATHGWSVERFLSEYRGAKTKQQSSLALGQFANKEDRYDAQIPHDTNSPNVTYPTINGNKMRSKALQVLMKLDPSVVTLAQLHYVEVGHIDSPKNT